MPAWYTWNQRIIPWNKYLMLVHVLGLARSLLGLHVRARATGATPRPDRAPLRRPRARWLLLLLLMSLVV
jgi:hypothetical protein